MKLPEKVCGESHMRTCGRKEVAKLIFAFRSAIVLSRPMYATSSLQGIISSFHIYLRVQR